MFFRCQENESAIVIPSKCLSDFKREREHCPPLSTPNNNLAKIQRHDSPVTSQKENCFRFLADGLGEFQLEYS